MGGVFPGALVVVLPAPGADVRAWGADPEAAGAVPALSSAEAEKPIHPAARAAAVAAAKTRLSLAVIIEQSSPFKKTIHISRFVF